MLTINRELFLEEYNALRVKKNEIIDMVAQSVATLKGSYSEKTLQEVQEKLVIDKAKEINNELAFYERFIVVTEDPLIEEKNAEIAIEQEAVTVVEPISAINAEEKGANITFSI